MDLLDWWVDLGRESELVGVLLKLVLLRGLVLLEVDLGLEIQVEVAVSHGLFLLFSQQLSVPLCVSHWMVGQFALFLLHLGLLDLMQSVEVALDVVGVQEDADDIDLRVSEQFLASLV